MSEAPETPTPGAATVEGPTPEQEKERKRVLKRPGWALFFGVLGASPLAFYFGIRAVVDRKRALEAGRPYGAAGTAGAIIGMAVSAGWAVVLVSLALSGGGGGNYLTATELEHSIVTEGQFGTGANQQTPTDASCVSEDGKKRYTCLLTFPGGYQQASTVTVPADGVWVAR